MKTNSYALPDVIKLISLMLILPTTVIFVIGFGFSLLAGVFQLNIGFIALTLFLLIPGYSLYTLWWLIFNFMKTTLKSIPNYKWAGLLSGYAISLIIVTLFSLKGAGFDLNENEKNIEIIKTPMFGVVSPLLITTTIILYMWLKERKTALTRHSS